MPPKKTIHVSETALLAAVVEAFRHELAHIDAARAAAAAKLAEAERMPDSLLARNLLGDARWRLHRLEQAAAELHQTGIAYDLPKFAGRELSASERIRFQQALRRLEQAGLVRMFGRRAVRILPTEAGFAAAAQ